MKGMAYIIVLAFLVLGVWALFYVVLDHVYDDTIYPWGERNIIEGNMTTYQSYYRLVWEGLPVIVVFALFIFLLVWSQKRGVDDYV